MALSDDGFQLTTVCVLDKDRFGAESLERPAVVRLDRGWRIYVSCATPGSKHWRIDAIDAIDPTDFAKAHPQTVFPGLADIGVKDPVIRRGRNGWNAWICCHPLETAGEEDRMTTGYETSDDGLSWRWQGMVLTGRGGKWDARGARLTSLLPDGRATYDGRAGKEENFSERTGIATPGSASGSFTASGETPVGRMRYLDAVPSPHGGHLVYYETPRPDGSHDLRVESITFREDPRRART